MQDFIKDHGVLIAIIGFVVAYGVWTVKSIYAIDRNQNLSEYRLEQVEKEIEGLQIEVVSKEILNLQLQSIYKDIEDNESDVNDICSKIDLLESTIDVLHDE